jgi:hypothetical protein
MKSFRILAMLLTGIAGGSAWSATIDRMEIENYATYYHGQYGWYSDFMVFGHASSYLLSDGSSWASGAGWHPSATASLDSVTQQGSAITYRFDAPANGILFTNTDYSFGDHSSQGTLASPSFLELVATEGGTTGVIKGYAQITSNDMTWYGEPRFNFYSAPVGSFVYFEQNFTLQNTTFTTDLFTRGFTYTDRGHVDFTASPIPEPSTMVLMALGTVAIGAVRRRRGTPAA